MDVGTVRSNLAYVLTNVSGLRSVAYVPSKIEPPMAMVSIGAGQYDDTFAGAMTAEMGVLVLVARADDRNAQSRLNQYISPTGDYSIKAAVDASPTLSGAASSATVIGWADPAEFEVGGISYVGVEFTVEVCD
jgi:hypothetical protein